MREIKYGNIHLQGLLYTHTRAHMKNRCYARNNVQIERINFHFYFLFAAFFGLLLFFVVELVLPFFGVDELEALLFVELDCAGAFVLADGLTFAALLLPLLAATGDFFLFVVAFF